MTVVSSSSSLSVAIAAASAIVLSPVVLSKDSIVHLHCYYVRSLCRHHLCISLNSFN